MLYANIWSSDNSTFEFWAVVFETYDPVVQTSCVSWCSAKHFYQKVRIDPEFYLGFRQSTEHSK